MANKKQLKILLKGAATWNQWRADNPKATIDLGNAVLSEADLTGVDLRYARVEGARLSGANLSRADLRYAYFARARLRQAQLTSSDLTSAHLTEADLRGANLSDANLTYAVLSYGYLGHANLSGANLSGAKLYNANLSHADLRKTNLHKASTFETIFTNIDLSETVGLESVYHLGPSDIGINTMYQSKGRIPEAFLRGCGVLESLIVQMPSLVAAVQPIQFYSCFISYSSKDEELAQRLYADLQSKGVRCWFAPEDLKIGERFRRRIDEVIRVHDKLLLILSENSVASSWVEKEVEAAIESEDEQKRTVLFPVRLDDSVMGIKAGWPADVRRTRHIGDFRRWKEHDEYQKAFARLLADLKASA